MGVVRNEGRVLMFMLVISRLCSSRLLLMVMCVGKVIVIWLLGLSNG